MLYEKIIKLKQEFDKHIEEEKEKEKLAGLCVCDNCFQDRLRYQLVRSYRNCPFVQRYCLVRNNQLTDLRSL